jgi:hypothetical protein
MRRWVVVLSAFTISLGAATTVAGTAVADPPDNDPYTLSNGHAQGMSGVVYARGDAHSSRPGGGSSPNLSWHGGVVQTAPTAVHAIFWGVNWGNSSFVSDKLTGLSTFYSGLTGSSYAATNTEYSGKTSAKVSANVASIDEVPDLAAAPRRPSTSAVLGEVAKFYPNPTANAYYPVYIDQPRGGAGYCAWHSAGTINGIPVQFGFFFNLDGDPGCDPGSPTGLHSQGLAALANVSGHEFSEMVTDPQLNAWYDSQGNENADKCAWTFNGLETLGSTQWLIQGNWSNAANNAGTGYTRGGCINGYKTGN